MRPTMTGLILVFLLHAASLSAQKQSDSLRIVPTSPQLTQAQARLILLRSLVVPGWGEQVLGKQRRAVLFSTVEVLGWASYYFWHSSGAAYKKDMKAFAVTHAGIDPRGKEAYYFVDIGNYDNIYAYNEQKLRNRQVDYLYPVTSAYYWAWDSAQNRRVFEKLRIRSAAHQQYATFTLLGLALNRIVSMLDIVLLTRSSLPQPEVELESSCFPTKDGATLTLGLRF